jgi:hypothetical protein
VLQLAFGSTVVAVVFVVQDAKRLRSPSMAPHLVTPLLTATVGSAALVSTLYIRRRDRRKKESWVKLEMEKYKRDMQKSQKEVDRSSAIGNRLEKEYRSASRQRACRVGQLTASGGASRPS